MSASAQVGQDFTFDPELHEYRERGIVRRSVTQVLNDAHLVCYDHIAPRILKRKAEIGTAAHLASWFFDEGDLDWRTVDSEVLGYVNGWAKARAECDLIIQQSETHGIAEMAGVRYGYTFDRKCLLNGIPTLGEIKCTASIEPSWGPQTAAYEYALYQIDGIRRQRVAFWLKPEGTYRLIQLPEVQDYQIFRVALTKPAGWEQIIEKWLASKGRQFYGNSTGYTYES